MNVLANIMSYYNNGDSDIFHFVLGRILTNLDLLLNATIYDVAEYCSASPATISRLAQKLGYKNYSDLKANVSEAVSRYGQLNRVSPAEQTARPSSQTSAYLEAVERSMRIFRESVDDGLIGNICKALKEARHVCFYSFAYCSTELHLQINLTLDGKSTDLCQRFPDQLKSVQQLDGNSMIVIIAPDRSDSIDIATLLAEARTHGARTLLVTDRPQSANREAADFFLAFEGTGFAMDTHFLYMFIDLINIRYRSMYLDKN